ncbi:MAG: phage major tail protein, TP901-1 family [Beijerinckiaceae bacterium]
MAAQRGKDMLLKLRDEGDAFIAVAGLRSRRIALNAETVDVTHAESAGRWRELLSGAGVKRASITGAGVFKDQASDLLVRQSFFDGMIRDWQIIIPNFGTIEGAFQIASLDYRAEHQGEITFDMTLESAGMINFAAF